MTALSVTSHVLLMTNIPADQLSGEVWTGVVFWSKLNTRLIGSTALNMGYMLPKFHGHIQVVDLPRISTLPLHGLHPNITVIVNHDTNTVVWASEGHGKSVLEKFYKQLTPEQLSSIRVVTGDGAKWITECVNEGKCVPERMKIRIIY